MNLYPLSKIATAMLISCTLLTACNNDQSSNETNTLGKATAITLLPEFKDRLDIYKEVTLTTDLSHLSANQKKMLSFWFK